MKISLANKLYDFVHYKEFQKKDENDGTDQLKNIIERRQSSSNAEKQSLNTNIQY